MNELKGGQINKRGGAKTAASQDNVRVSLCEQYAHSDTLFTSFKVLTCVNALTMDKAPSGSRCSSAAQVFIILSLISLISIDFYANAFRRDR